MAYKLTTSNTYISITDDPLLTLPNGDWSVGGWIKISQQNSTDESICNWAQPNTFNSFNIYVQKLVAVELCLHL